MASSTGRRLLIFIINLKHVFINEAFLLKGQTWKWIVITFAGKSLIFEEGNMGFNVIILFDVQLIVD